MKFLITVICLLLCCATLFAQENSFKRNHISLMTGYGLVPLGENGSTRQNLIVPALGIDYNYGLSEQFCVGLVSDIELANYGVEKDSSIILQRQNAFLIGVSGDIKVYKDFKLGTAIAREFERHKNLWVLRFQLEYEIEISEEWYVAPIMIYNYKEEFDTWTLGINIGRSF